MEEGKEEFYQTPPAVDVKGQIIPQIGEVNMEKDSRFPFLKFLKDQIPVFSVASISPDQIGEDEVNRSTLRLVKPTIHHGRSYEIRFAPPTESIVWEDENGIIFGAINMKGNNLEDPKVKLDKYSPHGLKTIGLQDSYALQRIIKASKELRRIGVETEKVELVIKPKELIWQGRSVSPTKFRKKLLEKAEEEIEAIATGQKVPPSFPTSKKYLEREHLDKVKSYLDSEEFFFTVRGLQVTERLRDLEAIGSKEEFEEMITQIFKFVNLRSKLEQEQHKVDSYKKFDPKKEEDVVVFFTEYLPDRIAANLVKMHNTGIAHGFLTAQNISLAGSIYDLDSVRGVLEGEKVALEDFGGDIDAFLISMTDAFRILRSERVAKTTGGKWSWFKDYYGEQIQERFFERFFETYFDRLNLKDHLFTLDDFRKDWADLVVKDIVKEGKREKKGQVIKELRKARQQEGFVDEITEVFLGSLKLEIKQVVQKVVPPECKRKYGSVRPNIVQITEKVATKTINHFIEEEVTRLTSQIEQSFYEKLIEEIMEKVTMVDW